MASKKRGGGLAGVDNTFRKTWDVDEYAEKAKSREDKVSWIMLHDAFLICFSDRNN